MRLVAALIDSRAAASGGKEERGPSLLLAPLGSGTVLSHCLGWLRELTGEAVTVLPAFAPEPAYARAILRTEGVAVLERKDVPRYLRALEPSDWLLLVDPRLFALVPPAPEAVRAATAGHLRWATHWVALESATDEMEETVALDEFGQVTRMERNYADVTRPRARGTAFSLLPVAPLQLIGDPPTPLEPNLDLRSIAALRAVLAARDVPSREFAIAGGTIDIAEEGGLARLIERSVRDLTADASGAQWIGQGCRIDPTARVLGPIVLQDGAAIGPGATIAGPALIGAGARIEADAVVAQSAISGLGVVERGRTVRHVVLGDAEAATEA